MADFNAPERTNSFEGKERKFGFELEFAGTSVEQCAEIVIDALGGSKQLENQSNAKVKNTEIGDVGIELDAMLVKKTAQQLENKKDATKFEKELSKKISQFASEVVPCEIVTQPLTLGQLPLLEKLREALRKKDAQGTKTNILYAFGMHINPEIASDDVEYIRDILKAFAVLYPWLKKVMDIDLSRRILTYIDPFPKDYLKHILPDDYQPDVDKFIEDYIAYNPTRNRALDLLPLFAFLSPDMLQQIPEAERELVQKRPTFHYRLPNCEIEDSEWTIVRDWNYWLEVEKLAEDKEKLSAIAKDYIAELGKLHHITDSSWLETLKEKYHYDT